MHECCKQLSREKSRFNPLPHGVLATFSLTAGGPRGPPEKDDISRETTILMTSLRTHWTSAVRREGLYCTYPPLPPSAMERSLCTVTKNYIVLYLCLESKIVY